MLKRKLLLKGIALFTIIATILPGIGGNISMADENNIIAGADRYETNLAVINEVLKNKPEVEGVVIASGTDYPDALSAGNIAYKYKYYLILEDEYLEEYLKQMKPKNIIIVGGKNTVLSDTELEMRINNESPITRLAGSDRYQTSKAVVDYISNMEKKEFKTVGVKGNNFPDALSAVPFAAKNDSLVLLSDNKENSFKATIGGGVPGNTERNIAGYDRYVTSQEVVSEFKGDNLIVVKGNNYPDALSASSLAGVLNANILLVNPTGMTVRDYEIVKSALSNGKSIHYIGGGVPVYDPNVKPIEPTPPVEPIEPTEPSEPIENGPSEEEILEARKEVFRLINLERTNAGLKELTWNEDLTKGVQIRAKEIIEKFDHIRPDGTDFGKAFEGIEFSYLAENLGAAYNETDALVTAWMDSEGHRANILSDNVESMNIGYAFKEDTEFKHFWVLVLMK